MHEVIASQSPNIVKYAKVWDLSFAMGDSLETHRRLKPGENWVPRSKRASFQRRSAERRIRSVQSRPFLDTWRAKGACGHRHHEQWSDARG